MFCKNCGSENSDTVSYCKECGQRVHEDGTSVQQPLSEPAVGEASTEVIKTKKKPVLLITLIGIVVAAIVLFAVIKLNQGESIDLSDYYQIEITGLNGTATAEVVFYYDYNEDQVTDPDKLKDWFQKGLFIDTITFDLDKESGIQNGDTVKAVAVYDKEQAKSLGLSFKNTTLTKKVEGLSDGQEIDLFDGLEVTYEGCAPYGSISLDNNNADEIIRTVRYTAEPSENLKNGDTVIITAEYDDSQMMEQNMFAKSETMSVTVEDLPELIGDSHSFTDQQYAQIERELLDIIEADIAGRQVSFFSEMFEDNLIYWRSKELLSHTSPKLVSTTLLTLKDASEYQPYSQWGNNFYNSIIFIYEIDAEVSLDNGDTHKISGYVSAAMREIAVDSEGTILYTDARDYSHQGDYPLDQNFSYDKLYEKGVTSYKSNYIVTELQ